MMLTSTETRQLIRAGRFSNARRFFLKDPLTLLIEAEAIGLDIEQALHCAGPSLKAAPPVAVFTSRDLEQVQEMAEAMAESQAEQYGKDYDYWADRNLKATGRAYTGD